MTRWSVAPHAFVLGALLLLGLLTSLVQGAINLPAGNSLLAVLDALIGSRYSTLLDYQQVVVVDLRLPRVLLAVVVGALLAQCGAVMQGLFRNPLADPGIVGVSSGAAVGAILAIAWLVPLLGDWTIPVCAFAGGLVVTLLVYRLAKTHNGTSVMMLLLAGIAVSAFAGAVIGFISYISNDQVLRDLSLWQMGSLAGGDRFNLAIAYATLLILLVAFQRRAAALNALLLGEPEARHLGIRVERLKIELVVLTAIGVGVAVSCSGIIGFVGLVVPHLVRLTVGPCHHTLLPLSALMGAVLLLYADLVGRLLLQPAELPVGLVTALIGAPFFLVLLLQMRRRGA